MAARPPELNAGMWGLGFRFRWRAAPPGLLRSEVFLHIPTLSLDARPSAAEGVHQRRPVRRRCREDRDPGIARLETGPGCRPMTPPPPAASHRGIPCGP